jgi:hypothetical protein
LFTEQYRGLKLARHSEQVLRRSGREIARESNESRENGLAEWPERSRNTQAEQAAMKRVDASVVVTRSDDLSAPASRIN